MTVAIDVEQRIARPPSEVWSRLTDWSRAPEWMEGIDWLSADAPTELGTRLRFRARGKERESVISRVVPGMEVALTSRQGPVCATYTYACLADGEGTRVQLVAECEIRGPLRVLGPLLRLAIRRTDGGQLQRLAELLESTTSGS